MSKRQFSVLSLFTGGGGLDIGLEMAGLDTTVCVDNDPESCKTLRHNRPNWEVFEGDIRNFEPKGKFDLVVGGPPCQGFSTAGKGNPDDPRNFLWREYFRIVEKVRPLALLLENVAGMANKKNAHHLNEFILHLEQLGYSVTYGILNAADFGVPQERKRLILLAGLGWTPALPKPTHTDKKVSAKQAIGDLAQGAKKGILNHEPNDHAPMLSKGGRIWPKVRLTPITGAGVSIPIVLAPRFAPAAVMVLVAITWLDFTHQFTTNYLVNSPCVNRLAYSHFLMTGFFKVLRQPRVVKLAMRYPHC